MKEHTSQFKEELTKMGKEIDNIITYGNVTLHDELYAVTPHYEGNILKSVMKQLDVESSVDIPLDTVINYQLGVKVGNNYEYIDYGNYIVYKSEKKEDTKSYLLTCYDKMLYAMKDNEDLGVVYPISIKDYLNALASKIGLEVEDTSFQNESLEIEKELYVGLEYTYRDILDEIAQATGSFICINENDKLEVKYPKLNGTEVEKTGKDIDISEHEDNTILNLKLNGETSQATRSGKNLFNIIPDNEQKGVKLTYNPLDGSYTLNGLCTQSYNFALQSQTLEAGNYTLQCAYEGTLPNNTSSRCNLYGTSLNITILNNSSNYYARTFSIANTTTDVQFRIRIDNGFNYQNVKLYPMLVKGTYTADNFPVFEPYGVMPSPKFPSPIINVEPRNLLNVKFEGGTKNDVEFKVNKDGSIVLNGTASANGTVYLNKANGSSNYQPIKAGTYYVGGALAGSSTTYFIQIALQTANSGGQRYFSFYHSGIFKVEQDNGYDICIAIRNGTVYNNLTFYPIVAKVPTRFVPYNNLLIENQNKNLFTGFIKGIGLNSTTGVESVNTTGATTDFIPVDFSKNPNYYVSGLTTTLNSFVASYNEKGQFLGRTNGTVMSYWALTSNSFTRGTPQGTGDIAYLRLIQYYASGNTGTIDDIDNLQIQLETGNTATDYIEHQEQVYNFPLGDIKLMQGSTLEDSGNHNIRKQIVLDGSADETWLLETNPNFTNVERFETPLSFIIKNPSNSLCSHFKYSALDNDVEHFRWEQTLGNYKKFRIYIDKTKATTVAELRTWLQSNPITVEAELQTAEIIPYTEEQQEAWNKINFMKLYDGVNHISSDASLSFKYIGVVEKIDEEYLKDINVKFGEKYGPVNSVVLSRSAESDNIYLRNEDSVIKDGLCEIKIVDNQILNWNNRSDYLQGILEAVNGIEYYINDYSSPGLLFYELGDYYGIVVGENAYKCLMLNDEINVTLGIEELVHTEMPEESETDYTKADKTDRRINQAYIIVDKQEQKISSLVETTGILDDNINNGLENANGEISNLKTRTTKLEQDAESFSIFIEDYEENGAKKIKTTIGYRFDDEGLKIDKTNAETGTIIDEASIRTTDKTGSTNEDLFYAGYVKQDNQDYPTYRGQTIVYSKNMIVQNYLVVPGSRLEAYTNPVLGGQGTGVFEI